MGSSFTTEIRHVNHHQSRYQAQLGTRQCDFDPGVRQRTQSDQLHFLPNQNRTSIHFDQSQHMMFLPCLLCSILCGLICRVVSVKIKYMLKLK